jgi:hypothetical protein
MSSRNSYSSSFRSSKPSFGVKDWYKKSLEDNEDNIFKFNHPKNTGINHNYLIHGKFNTFLKEILNKESITESI